MIFEIRTMNFTFFNQLGSNGAKTNFLCKYETIANDFEIGLAIQDSISDITSEEIKNIIEKYFSPNNRTIIAGVPK